MTHRAAWIGFIAMSVGMFMAILDIQIVASSLPDIQVGLRIPRTLLSWVQTSYLIAEVVAIMLSGCLTPVLSTGGLFTSAVLGFTLASLGCACSDTWQMLIVCRVIQGFCGGAIIPTVFSAGYKLFPPALQSRATLIAGGLAMLAPTLGPCLGGYITDHFNWPWLFLVNIVPGVIVAAVTGYLIRIDRSAFARIRQIDAIAAILLTSALAAIELLLNRGPREGWSSGETLAYVAVILGAGFIGLRRCCSSKHPLIDLRLFRERRFSGACALNFVFGAGLYGSVYLLPLFLGFVRDHTALEIGVIMTVMGAAQLLSAPFAAIAGDRWPPVPVVTLGLVLFTTGMIANGFATPRSDAAALFWPQVLRGFGVLLVILPLTSVALSTQPHDRLPDASALLNLFRNLGGAIGIALVDTVTINRAPEFADSLAARLAAGDRAAARFAGLPLDRFHGQPLGPVSPADRELARPLIEHAAATLAFNEAWLILGGALVAALLLIPLLRRNEVTPASDLL